MSSTRLVVHWDRISLEEQVNNACNMVIAGTLIAFVAGCFPWYAGRVSGSDRYFGGLFAAGTQLLPVLLLLVAPSVAVLVSAIAKGSSATLRLFLAIITIILTLFMVLLAGINLERLQTITIGVPAMIFGHGLMLTGAIQSVIVQVGTNLIGDVELPESGR